MNKKVLVIISIAILAAIVAVIIIRSYYNRKIEDLLGSIPSNVKLQEKIEKGVDEWDGIESSIVINSDIENLGNGYTINKETGIVYYQGVPMSGADAGTFKVLENGYAKDKNTVYLNGKEFEEDSNSNSSSSSSSNNSENNSDDSSSNNEIKDNNGNSSSEPDVYESWSHATSCTKSPEGVSKFGIGERDRPTFTVCELGECGECNF